MRASAEGTGRESGDVEMTRVTTFISHAHGESELAALLKASLVQDFIGLIDIFVSSDFKSIGAGEDWYSVIMSAVRARRYIPGALQPGLDHLTVD
jgi:hypothetical protein